MKMTALFFCCLLLVLAPMAGCTQNPPKKMEEKAKEGVEKDKAPPDPSKVMPK